MFRIRNIRNSPFPASQRNWFGALKHCLSTDKIYNDTYFIPNFYNTADSNFGSVSDISTESNYALTFSVSEFGVFAQVLDSKVYFAEKSMIDAQLHSLSDFVNSTDDFDSEFEEFQNLSVSSFIFIHYCRFFNKISFVRKMVRRMHEYNRDLSSSFVL